MRFFSLRSLAAWLAAGTMLGGVSAAAAEPAILRLRADSWMPYNGDPGAPTPGYVVEVARTIFGAHGITVDYQTMPWADALKAAGNGEIEGVIGANEIEAKGLVLPAEPIGLPRIGLFTLKQNPWQFVNVQALRQVKLGVIEGYSYWDVLDDHIKKRTGPEVVWLKGDAPLRDGIAKLDAGEINVMAETMAVWVWTVKSLGRSPADYRMAYLHQAEPIFLGFAVKGEQGRRYAQWWDEGLRELRTSGKLTAILSKYGLVDWK